MKESDIERSNDLSKKVTLGVGVCFGEIALLGTGRMNRRTANVRCPFDILCMCEQVFHMAL